MLTFLIQYVTSQVMAVHYQCAMQLISHFKLQTTQLYLSNSVVPRNFFVWGGSTNSVEDRGQREWGSGGGNPLVTGSNQFANE
jgi:hypothetical protein